LLFDEQLSEELCRLLEDIFPGSLHIRQIGADVADIHRFAEQTEVTFLELG
jgi:predicted nuclease of predicted toxin-antitoxin system